MRALGYSSDEQVQQMISLHDGLDQAVKCWYDPQLLLLPRPLRDAKAKIEMSEISQGYNGLYQSSYTDWPIIWHGIMIDLGELIVSKKLKAVCLM
jgi:hypothetical protein